VLDFEAVYEIDAQAADTISALAAELRRSGTTLVIARAHAPVRSALERLGTMAELGEAAMYATVRDAVDRPEPPPPAQPAV
jgi:MFS superfamily sulfate permease-like transporter